MFGKQFKDVYRHFNIRMSVEDQKLMYDFLRVDKNPMESLTPRENEQPESQKFDLNQLAKIVDCLSRDYYNSLLEKFEFPERPNREK